MNNSVEALFSPFENLMDKVKPFYLVGNYRKYHTMDHIYDCLRALRHVGESDDPACQLALLYHDAIYAPGSIYNEEASADLLRYHMKHLGCVPELYSDEVVKKAANMIHATKLSNHLDQRFVPDRQTALVMDCDLWSLSSEHRFDLIQDTIIGEANGGWLTDSALASEGLMQEARDEIDRLRSVQAKFMDKFLVRPYIYHTLEFRAKCEARARNNIYRYKKKYG